MTTTPAHQPDWTCSICQDMFREPYICDCGHSFCKICIDHWISRTLGTTTPSCPICRKAVTRTTANITLRQVVEERRRLAATALSADSSPATSCLSLETPSGTPHFFQRSGSMRSGRRCRFAENDEVFSPSFSAPRRKAPSLNAMPLRSALVVKTPTAESLASESQDDNDDSQDDSDHYDEYDETRVFTRNAHIRRSEFIPRTRDDSATILPVRNNDQFLRDSRLRRSIGVLRRKSKARDEIITSATETAAPPTNSTKKDVPKSKLKAFWRRLIAPRSKAPKVALAPSAVSNVPLILRSLCSYSGVNANFKRIGRGDEITILVVGKRGVGKTTFLDNLTLSVEADRRHKMVGLADRLTWSQQQTQSRELAHMTSVVLMGEGTPRMVDVIDADCEDKITDGVYDCSASGAFVNAGDAAILLYSPGDSSSLLTAMAIQRRLATKQIPCVLVANKFGHLNALNDEMVQTIAQRMNAKRFETSLNQSPNSTVIEIVQHLADRVSQSRPS